MSFSSVFKSLQELFPQVDRRMLRAVAIEHTEDVNAAVEFILTEVLSSVCSAAEAPNGQNGQIEEFRLSLEHQEVVKKAYSGTSESNVLASEHSNDSRHSHHTSEVSDWSSPNTPKNLACSSVPNFDKPSVSKTSESNVLASEHSNDSRHSHHTSEVSDWSSPNTPKNLACSSVPNFDKPSASKTSESNVLASEHSNDSHHSHHTSEVSDWISPPKNLACLSVPNFDKPCASMKTLELNFPAEHQVSDVMSSFLNDDTIFFDCNNVDHSAFRDLNKLVASDANISVSSESILVEPCSSASLNETENVLVRLDSLPVCNGADELAEEASESQISSDGSKKPETSCSPETSSSGLVPDSKVADFEDGSFSTTVTTQSGHICRIDVLEDAISEAKNNKKTLFSSMESVITMMREVEDLEKAAEHAKEDAVRGGLDILAKVEEIRQMLLHAKEANDMHAGEVYGEKSILATEARELQSRLVNLSYERDRSLAILDEMRQALEARMKAAEEVKKAAENDRLEKESSARKALLEQEVIMEKVVQESKRLQSEAEENSKLREFLMDRGKVVDVLQGEISVICQDVKSLKENFDDRVPLSKSLSSSHTSCILASSGSSGKSIASSLVPEQVESSESLQMSSTESVEDFPETVTPLITEGGEKKRIDDDWDLFEDDSELYNLRP